MRRAWRPCRRSTRWTSAAPACWKSSPNTRRIRLGQELDGDAYLQGRCRPGSARSLPGVVRDQRKLDPLIGDALQRGLGAVAARCHACAPSCAPACFELMERKDVPVAVIVTEYVEIAKAFFERRGAASWSTRSSTASPGRCAASKKQGAGKDMTVARRAGSANCRRARRNVFLLTAAAGDRSARPRRS